jgi:hypothetical protein
MESRDRSAPKIYQYQETKKKEKRKKLTAEGAKKIPNITGYSKKTNIDNSKNKTKK